jgi:hypothetical protein
MDRTLLGCLLLGLAAPALAQQADPPQRGSEPKVQRIVVEDDAVRIDELRVRGQTQRIVVQPKKGGMRPYEIVPADGGRDMSQSYASGRGAAGQRVWHVLNF